MGFGINRDEAADRAWNYALADVEEIIDAENIQGYEGIPIDRNTIELELGPGFPERHSDTYTSRALAERGAQEFLDHIEYLNVQFAKQSVKLGIPFQCVPQEAIDHARDYLCE
jgi:hypothetical protein